MDFKISKPTLSDIPAMRNLVLPEVQKGIILDRSEDEMAGVIRSYSVIRVVDSASDNSVLGMQFRTKNAESSLDSAISQNLNKNNPSLRADSQNLRGKPFCERIAESTESRLDSATRTPLTSFDSFSQKGCAPRPAPPNFFKLCSQKLPLFAFRGRASLSPLLAKNRRLHFCNLKSDFLHHEAGEFSGASHKIDLDSANFADSAISTQEANSSIVDEFLQLCELSDKDRTDGSSRKRSERNCEKSPQDDEFTEFEVRILDFPGFGYAKVSKAEKSSWDRHLSEFLKKRDSIKLYLHLIDSRHQNLEIDNEIFAFLNRFKRGDCAILQVFTKADKLSKNELSRLKKQNKLYHSINDKNSTEILRCAILKLLYNVDF